ncbi:MAG: hypothetical protein Unbinned2706contig1001_45 [Prokaryotic dsDNA virus sp.]|nr:MAG: hypothetical protein Unbinned2706contig1001_45 [Prokaryotic dsDNA virus sp.]|tara:strand:+ start:16264 stop:16584 length:321 start_codon:yes stop_codon:yes gene_type:complete
MGLQETLIINLTDSLAVSAPVKSSAYKFLGAVLFTDPDQSYSLGSGVVTLQFSADGTNFVNSNKTFSNSDAGEFSVDITGVQSIRFSTTTADGAADPSAHISVYLQ